MAKEEPQKAGVAGLPQLLKVAEVSTILNVDQRTLRAWIAARKIGVVRLSSRCLRIPSGELERFIEERLDGPKTR